MYSLQELKKELSKAVSCNESDIVKAPEDVADFSYSGAFKKAKEEKKNPKEIAESIAKKIKKPKLIKEVKTAGPYINFEIDYDKFSEQVLEEAVKEKYGSSDFGKKKIVVIDYSSPNICKPFHIGHLRSTIIGNSLYRINEFIGFKPFGENYIGDWGLQFGKLLCEYEKCGNEKELLKEPMKYLVKLYVDFHKKEDENLKKEAEQWLSKLEKNDKRAIELWKKFRELSLIEFDKIYKRLGITFDSINGEAFYSKYSNEIIGEAFDKKVAIKEKDGTVVIPLEKYGLTNARLLENDRTLYITREIAAAKYRYKTLNFYKSIYVVGATQDLHFKQFVKTLELMKLKFYKNIEIVKFGQFSLPEGKISTREGNFIELNDVLDKSIEKAEKILSEKKSNTSNRKKAAEIIGIGAVKFADLSQNRIKDVVFNIDEMISFEGDTSPYLQYAYARCNSILKQAKKKKPDYKTNKTPEEKRLIMEIAEFPEVIIESAMSNEPHRIANYLLKIARSYSNFYENCKVLGSKEESYRLRIVEAVANVLKIGLNLLGISVLEVM